MVQLKDLAVPSTRVVSLKRLHAWYRNEKENRTCSTLNSGRISETDADLVLQSCTLSLQYPQLSAISLKLCIRKKEPFFYNSLTCSTLNSGRISETELINDPTATPSYLAVPSTRVVSLKRSCACSVATGRSTCSTLNSSRISET